MTVGINYRHNTLSSNFTNGFHDENRLGIYLQDEWLLTSGLRLISGVRYDLSSGITPTVSPRIALIVYPRKDHTVRLSYAEGFRPPTLVDRHLHFLNNVSRPLPKSVSVMGSSDLKPEHIRSYELGYQGWFLKHRLRTRASIFYNELSDLIEFRGGTAPDLLPTVATNVGEAEIYGSEIGLEAWVTPWLRGFVNVTYQDIEQKISEENRRVGPEFKVNGGVRLDGPYGLSGEILVHYVEATTHPPIDVFSLFAPLGVEAPPTHLNSYTLLNLRGGYRFWDDQAELAVSVFNALNDRHKEHPQGDSIGSRVMGWLTVKWGFAENFQRTIEGVTF